MRSSPTIDRDDLVLHTRHRVNALHHAVRPSTWLDALRLNAADTSTAAALRVGVAVAVVLVIGGLAGQYSVAGIASLGAIVSAFCRPDPYRVRMPRLVFVAVMLWTSVAVGGLLAVLHAPIAVQIVVMALLGGVGALVVAALHLVGPGAVVMVFAANAALGSVADWRGLVTAMVSVMIGTAVGFVAAIAPWIWVQVARAFGRDVTLVEPAAGVAYDSIARSLVRVTDRRHLELAGRVVVASALAAGVAVALGLQHPMWAAMGALAALVGVQYHNTVRRGVQRLLGNVGGAAIAAVLLMIPLGFWWSVVFVVIFQTIAEIMAPRNYGITSLVVTPMALLMTALGAGLSSGVALTRVFDTFVGVVIGIVIAAVTITRDDRVGDPSRS